MKSSRIVTTNLRIPEDLLRRVRIRAAEEGISANEYMTRIIREKTWEEQFLPNREQVQQPKQKTSKSFIASLLALAKMPNEPEEEYVSEDDKIIYGI